MPAIFISTLVPSIRHSGTRISAIASGALIRKPNVADVVLGFSAEQQEASAGMMRPAQDPR